MVCTNKLSEINQTVGGFNQFQRTPGGTGYEMSNRTQYENIPPWTLAPNIDKLDWEMGAGGVGVNKRKNMSKAQKKYLKHRSICPPTCNERLDLGNITKKIKINILDLCL